MENKQVHLKTISNGIDSILMGDYKHPLEVDAQGEVDEIAKKINELASNLQYLFNVARNIARGNLSIEIEGTRGIAAVLKSIQSNFLHIAWQAKRVAAGQLSQKIIALGDISEAFNEMVKTLKEAKATVDERTQQLEEAKSQLQIYSFTLEQKVEERTRELKEKNIELQRLFINTIQGLSNTLEAKDKYTREHSTNVAKYAVLLAEKLKFSENEIESLKIAGNLHDIGKIGIKESILNKPVRFTKEEYEHIKMHPLISVSILEPIKELGNIINYIRHHHERFDGNGYPDGLKGANIPIGARVLAIADAYDAMLSDRSYRNALKKDKVISELTANKGSQFDPRLVDLFISLIA